MSKKSSTFAPSIKNKSKKTYLTYSRLCLILKPKTPHNYKKNYINKLKF